MGCGWGTLPDETGVLSINWVRDGRWAFERMLRIGTTSPVELAGLGPEDAAVLRCFTFGENEETCAVDLRIGQDWFNVHGADTDLTLRYAEAMLAQLANSPK